VVEKKRWVGFWVAQHHHHPHHPWQLCCWQHSWHQQKKVPWGWVFGRELGGAEGALADCLATQQFAMAIIRYNLLLSSLQSSCKNAGKNEKREFELGRWEICEKVNKNRKGIYFIYEEQLPLPINMGFHLPK